MSTILIVGGAGYIGSQTNYCLLDQNFQTVVLDNLVYGHTELISENSPFILGDLGDKESLKQVFQKFSIQAVLHFAAFAYVGESVLEPAKYYQNNLVGTLNLLEIMREFKVKNLVFSSTCATYGIPETVPIKEDTLQKPINPYGRSKLMVEQILQDYHQAYGLSFIALRYFNACGADTKLRTGEWHEPETHLIPLILQVASKQREKISIYGNDYPTKDGTCIRDYIHTEDLAEAHILALKKLLDPEQKTSIAEFINLGTGKGFSVKEIIEMVENITQVKIKVEIAPRRPGDPAILIADKQKAEKYLNWQAKHSSLENIIKTAWNWEQFKQKNFTKKL